MIPSLNQDEGNSNSLSRFTMFEKLMMKDLLLHQIHLIKNQGERDAGGFRFYEEAKGSNL